MIGFRIRGVFAAVLAISSGSCFGFEYYDNFEGWETGGLTHNEFNAKISAAREVQWRSEVRTSVVNVGGGVDGIDEPVPLSPKHPKMGNGPLLPELTGNASNAALRFFYPGDPDLNKDSWSEQRFLLKGEHLAGKKGLTEVWFQYDLYIPKNFHVRDSDPGGSNPFVNGHKVLSLYADGYSNPNPTLILGRLYRRSDFGDPSTEGTIYLSADFAVGDAKSSSGRSHYKNNSNVAESVLIKPTVDLGHWQRRTLRLRMPTSETSNDGVIEMWVKRRAETSAPITEKVLEMQNGSFHGGSQNYINGGYILGWSNMGYNDDTVYLVDNVVISDSPESLDKSAVDLKHYVSLPNPPAVTVQ